MICAILLASIANSGWIIMDIMFIAENEKNNTCNQEMIKYQLSIMVNSYTFSEVPWRVYKSSIDQWWCKQYSTSHSQTPQLSFSVSLPFLLK